MTEPRPMTCAQVEDIAGIYVLGALEDVEAAAVSVHLASCPEATRRSLSWPRLEAASP